MVDKLTATLKRLPSWLGDVVMAVALTAIGMAGLAARPFDHHGAGGGGPLGAPNGLQPGPGSPTNPFGTFGQVTPIAYVLTAAGFLPLAVRQEFPLEVLVFTSLVEATFSLGHFPPNFIFIAPLIAMYTVADKSTRKTAIAAGVVSAVIQLVGAWFGSGQVQIWTEIIRIVALLGVAGALGDASRNRRAYVAEVEQRAAAAERTREEEARRRVDEERLRIARELHDITAHSLSVIAVQSGAAAHVIDSNPLEARKALEAIRATSKEALDELRAMLGVLRGIGDTDAPLAPAPGLARVAELVQPLEQAGYEVVVEADADLGEIPAVVEGSAYRIIQESLTNVMRHAGNCNVWLRVRRENSTLIVSVENDGATPALPLPEGGHGVNGMRERVMALGGEFSAEPRNGGGFIVSARLPIVRSS